MPIKCRRERNFLRKLKMEVEVYLLTVHWRLLTIVPCYFRDRVRCDGATIRKFGRVLDQIFDVTHVTNTTPGFRGTSTVSVERRAHCEDSAAVRVLCTYDRDKERD